MRTIQEPLIVVLLYFVALVACANAAQPMVGYALTANFIVHTENQRFAEEVAASAERHRAEISRQWFGGTLPDGKGRSVICVSINPSRTHGLTWAIDAPGRTLHNVWLDTSVENAVGDVLKHEICHTVFATFHNSPRVPKVLEERIALTYNAPRPESVPRLKAELARWQKEVAR